MRMMELKKKVYIPVESNSIVEDHGNKVPNHDYQELDDFIWTDEHICTFFYKNNGVIFL
uniref:Uncharacterized protein n=1 Tax=Klebsiella pneumoniae TaxID=573 RepID=A0A8B0SSW1_KLEPN|nr:hypothetical protein [Klebsiella pneumoniae]